MIIAALMVALAQAPRDPVAPTRDGTTAPASAQVALAGQEPGDSLVVRVRAAAVAADPRVGVARAALAVAEGRSRIAGARPPATLDFDAEELGAGGLGQMRLDLVQDWGVPAVRAAERAVGEAERDAGAARLRLIEARVSALVGRELAAWFGWRAVHARLLAEDSLLADVEAAVRGRFSVGAARYVDVLRVRSERVRVLVERADAAREAERARAVLLVSVPGGHPDAARYRGLLDSLARRAPAPLPLVPPLDPESLLVQSGILAVVEASARTAAHRAELLRASRRPSFTTGVGLQRFEGGGAATVGPTFTAVLSLPFTSGAYGASRQAADALLAAAQADRSAAMTQLRAAIAAARERFAGARERLQLLDAALLVGVREEREAALGSFRAGEFSLLELLDLERGLARVDIERARAVMDEAAALADLYAAAAGDVGRAAFRDGGSDDR